MAAHVRISCLIILSIFIASCGDECSSSGHTCDELEAARYNVKWSRLFGQIFRFDEWIVCRG